MCRSYELTTSLNKLPICIQETLPTGLRNSYASQPIICPSDPVLVHKQEHGVKSTTVMVWGFLPDWRKNPIDCPRPINARAETVATKISFQASWRNRRCLIPANGFFEKGRSIRKLNSEPFWLGGIWNRWLGADGSEIESCCILTTKANDLIKSLHHRMPVIIPKGLEDLWVGQADKYDLCALEDLLHGWSPNDWMIDQLKKEQEYGQINLF